MQLGSSMHSATQNFWQRVTEMTSDIAKFHPTWSGLLYKIPEFISNFRNPLAEAAKRSDWSICRFHSELKHFRQQPVAEKSLQCRFYSPLNWGKCCQSRHYISISSYACSSLRFFYFLFIYLFSFLRDINWSHWSMSRWELFNLDLKELSLSYRAPFGSIILLWKKVKLFYIAPPRLDCPRQTKKRVGEEEKEKEREELQRQLTCLASLAAKSLLANAVVGRNAGPSVLAQAVAHGWGGSGGLAALLLSQINEH